MKKNHVNSGPARLALTPAWAVSAAGGLGISSRRGLSRWLVAASGGADPESDDTIEVQRRRPTGGSDSAPRERAEAPVRRKTDGGGAAPPQQTSSGGGYQRPPAGRPPTGGPPMKLNLKTLLIGGALLLFVFVIGPRFFGGGDVPLQEPPVAQVQPEPTLPEAPGAASPARADGRAAESIAHGQTAEAHCRRNGVGRSRSSDRSARPQRLARRGR